MYIVLVYDIGEKRVVKMLKLCRRYVNWIQNSVFEGEISQVQLDQLKNEASKRGCWKREKRFRQFSVILNYVFVVDSAKRAETNIFVIEINLHKFFDILIYNNIHKLSKVAIKLGNAHRQHFYHIFTYFI